MQAIILAAGMGRRLGEFTRSNTKCMVEVNGVRLIDRLLTQLSKLSLKKVIIVTGFEGENLQKYIGTEYKGLPIEYIHNPIYDKTNNIYSLSLACEQLQSDDTLLIESDIIFEDALLKMILDCPDPNVALVAKYESWMDGTMVRIDAERNIVNFIPKKAFNYSDTGLYYKTVNLYKFSKEFSTNHYLPFLKAYLRVLGDNEYYEQVLRVLTLIDSSNIKALPLNGQKWYEIDDVQDLRIAETIFADTQERLSKIQRCYGGYWRYPSLLDFCYLVNPFFPSSRMIEEIKANFETLLREYPSGMSINGMLAAKYFGIKQAFTCVGNGAAELIKSLMTYLKGNLGVVFPTFEEYPNRKERHKIIAYTPDDKNFSYSTEELIAFFSDKSLQALLLVNPDNPSGNFIPKQDVLKLAEWCEHRNVHLIVDESFVDFSDDFSTNSLLDNAILTEHPRLVVMKSISKSYGVPGLRLGVLASADCQLVNWVKNDVGIWNINSFAEFYMQIFGKYESDYQQACGKFIEERKRFHNDLQQVPFLRIIPSQANYFLCEVTDKYSAKSLTATLLDRFNILIKDCSSKNGVAGKGEYVRIAIRNRSDNIALVKALTELSVQNHLYS